MLTLLYKDFDVNNAPKLNVVINNFSKVNPETNIVGEDGYGDENDDDEKDDGNQEVITCETIRTKYREFLTDAAFVYYNKKMDKAFI